MDSGYDFDYSFEIKLITEIKKHPFIYDVSLEDYKNTNLKEQTWNEIGFKVCENETSTVKCKKKWKHLRDTYKRCKERKKIRIAQKKPVTNWKHEKIMQFLDKIKSIKKLPIRPFEEAIINFDDENNSFSDNNNYGSFSPIDDTIMEDSNAGQSSIENSNADSLNADLDECDPDEDSVLPSTSSAASKTNIKMRRTQEEKLTEFCSIKPIKSNTSERHSLSVLFESLDKKIHQANLSEDQMTEIESSVFSLVFFKLNNYRKTKKKS